MKERIKKQIIQKRVDAIVKCDISKPKVSDPEPYLKKKLDTPLAQLH